jgi:uncharacterized protein YcgI (DUF1989 family)
VREVSPTELLVPGGYGRAAKAPAGALVTIVDLHGQQAGDFVAVAVADVTEGLSGVETRRHVLSLYIKTGDRLISSRGRPMFEVVADTIGVHDYTVPACDPTRYEVDFGVVGHRNCLENMAEALRRFGVDILEVPEPFNLFQSSPVIAGGRTAVIDPPLRASSSPSAISRAGNRLACSPWPSPTPSTSSRRVIRASSATRSCCASACAW